MITILFYQCSRNTIGIRIKFTMTKQTTITGLEVRGRYRALSTEVFSLGKHGIRKVLHISDVLMIEILYHQ